ncbi:unnamed protein product, partial [Cuscuta europaea]
MGYNKKMTLMFVLAILLPWLTFAKDSPSNPENSDEAANDLAAKIHFCMADWLSFYISYPYEGPISSTQLAHVEDHCHEYVTCQVLKKDCPPKLQANYNV